MSRLFLPGRLRTVALLAAALSLSACAGGGFSLQKAEVDRSLVTGTVQANSHPTDAERVSDEATIRNAVSAADVAGMDGGALAWANANTGSRGAISHLVERKDENGTLCRKFTTSRESFDGVGLYKGEVCLAGAGAWRMLAFQPAS